MLGEKNKKSFWQESCRLGPQMYRGLLLGIVAGVVALILWYAPFLKSTWESIDHFCLDQWIRLKAKGQPSKVIIVAIDDSSLKEIGPWPWPREKQARLLEILYQDQAKAVGIDLLYDKERPGDKALAKVMEKIPTVLAVYTDEAAGVHLKTHGLFVEHLFLPVKILKKRAFGLGHIVVAYDSDGIARRIPSFLSSPKHSVPAFGIALALAYYRTPWKEVIFFKDGLKVGPLTIPLDKYGNFFIGYQGGPRTFPTVSAAEVLAGRIPPEIFQNKVVLIGVTASKFSKKWATPFVKEGPMAGVEIQAHVVQSILDQRLPSLFSTPVIVALVFGLAVLAAYIAHLVPILLIFWLLIPALIITWGIGALSYLGLDKILPVTPLSTAMIFSFLNVFALRAWRYRRGLAERTAQIGALVSVSRTSSLNNLCFLLKELLKAQEVHGIFAYNDHLEMVHAPEEAHLPLNLTKFSEVENKLKFWLREEKRAHLLIPVKTANALIGWYLVLRTQPFNAEEKEKAEQFALHTAILLEKEQLLRQLETTKEGILQMWLKTMAQKSPDLYEHSLLVAQIAKSLAEALDLGQEKVRAVYEAGLLHDIGLIGAPDYIWQERDLGPEGRMWVENHPVIGAELLKTVPAFREISQLVRSHHERFDGQGYPDGLKGVEIPLEARILELAEAVVSLMEKRFQEGKDLQTLYQEVLEEIKKDAGRRFDPRLVDILTSIKWEFKK